MSNSDIPSYFHYWGKTSKDTGRYHLLPFHCLDVAAVGKVLLEKNSGLLKRLSILSGIEETNLKKILLFSLAIHDLGKYSETFQSVVPALLNTLQGKAKSLKQPYSRKAFCHGSIGFLLWKGSIFTQVMEMVNQDGVSNAEDWWDIFKWFLEASNGHHGLPVKQGNRLLDDYFSESDRQSVLNFINDLGKLLSIKELFNIDLDKNYERLSKQLAELSWLFAGFTVLCDWIGSGDAFEYISEELTLTQYWDNVALIAAERAVRIAGILPCKSNNELDPLNELLDFPENAKLTPLQGLVQRIKLSDKPQLFIIEDETGAGKTEACLILLNRLMARGLANGFYLGLPTMATADGIYPRIRKAYNKFYLSDQKPSLVLAHSSAKLSDMFTETIIYQNSKRDALEQPYADDAQSICQAWLADNRKKALLAHVGVGTIDQAFLAVLKNKYQSLRLIGLVGKVLVIDEAHAYDAYMGKELEVLLRTHASLGGSAIIMSATLPFSVRQDLSNAFLGGLDIEPIQLNEKEAYPLLTHISEKHKNEKPFSRNSRNRKKSVQVKFVHSENEVHEIIREGIRKGQCVCWIRNSVRDVRDTYKILKNEGIQVDLFHARYTVIDRSQIQDRVMNSFDKNSRHEQRRGKLVIATQVVEQSLDLDFDVMITDLAPIDSMLQRAGRMHRHVRDKLGNPKMVGSDERGLATLYIFTPEYAEDPSPDWFSTFFPNAKKVYENHARLWLGMKCLRTLPKNRLPQNIRYLIEYVYGSDAVIPQRLIESDIRASGNESSERNMGSFNTIDYRAGYTMDGQVWEDDTRVLTRLGEETVIMTIAKWEGGKLLPFTPAGKKAWQKNGIRVLKKNIDEVPIFGELQTVVDEVKQLMPGKGKWTNLLPMMWDAGKNLWAADVVNGKHCHRRVYYSSEIGLIYEYEFDSAPNDDQLEKDELI